MRVTVTPIIVISSYEVNFLLPEGSPVVAAASAKYRLRNKFHLFFVFITTKLSVCILTHMLEVVGSSCAEKLENSERFLIEDGFLIKTFFLCYQFIIKRRVYSLNAKISLTVLSFL